MADAKMGLDDIVYCPKCATKHTVKEIEIGEEKL